MEIIEARQGEQVYEVHVGEGAADGLSVLSAGFDKVAIVSCARVLRTPFAKRLVKRLSGRAQVALVHALPDGEMGKTLAELERRNKYTHNQNGIRSRQNLARNAAPLRSTKRRSWRLSAAQSRTRDVPGPCKSRAIEAQ